jgi:uncharacterized membrane protein YgdD (TMEM256/DUF423 family)
MSPVLLSASVLGALGVALGAFGAHGLRARVTPERLAVWQTATEYHLLHALALLGVAIWLRLAPATPGLSLAGGCFTLGVLVFSGSLYALVLTDLRWLGAITPLGGVLLIAGWISLAWAAIRLQPA